MVGGALIITCQALPVGQLSNSQNLLVSLVILEHRNDWAMASVARGDPAGFITRASESAKNGMTAARREPLGQPSHERRQSYQVRLP